MNFSSSTINQQNSNGMTELNIRATMGDVVAVSWLLEHGADPSIPNFCGDIPLKRALFLPIVYDDEQLIEKKENIFKLILVKSQQLANHQNQDGDTVIHAMAECGFANLLVYFLKEHADVAFIANNASRYPIHTAILNNNKNVIDVLLTLPGTDSLMDAKGRLPIHYAAKYSGKEIVESCCLVTSNINHCDGNGKTALQLAEEAGNDEAVEVLIKFGAIITDVGLSSK